MTRRRSVIVHIATSADGYIARPDGDLEASRTSFFSVLGVRAEARSFAADWDRQDSELKNAKQSGLTDVAVEQVGDFRSRIGRGPSDLHLRTDPAFWINRTTARYYSLNSVRGRIYGTSSLRHAGPSPIFTTLVTNVTLDWPTLPVTSQQPGVGKIK
jgi:hypothetical protein